MCPQRLPVTLPVVVVLPLEYAHWALERTPTCPPASTTALPDHLRSQLRLLMSLLVTTPPLSMLCSPTNSEEDAFPQQASNSLMWSIFPNRQKAFSAGSTKFLLCSFGESNLPGWTALEGCRSAARSTSRAMTRYRADRTTLRLTSRSSVGMKTHLLLRNCSSVAKHGLRRMTKSNGSWRLVHSKATASSSANKVDVSSVMYSGISING